MIIDKYCGYFNEEINDPYSPYPGECEDCYRYDTCLNAKYMDINKECEEILESYFSTNSEPLIDAEFLVITRGIEK